MNSPCPRLLERLIAHAEGSLDPIVELHVASCRECAEALKQFQQVFRTSSRYRFTPPVEVVERAKAIFPAARRTVVARVLRTSALSSARAVPTDLQVSLDADGFPMRVMYSRREAGWDVLGSLPGPDWNAEREHGSVERTSESRFSFLAAHLDSTGFRVGNRDVSVIVPPLEELLYGSTGAR
jgi:hypothetical protein